MNYIIYDLEFNQKNNEYIENENNQFSSIPFEIIQIGAVKLNENFETISTFDALIKPTIYKTIHPLVENLTKITDEQVSSCKNFIAVYKDFLNFIGDDETILCVWGTVDIKELMRNVKFYSLSTSPIFKYIDLQAYASKYLKTENKFKIGLKTAIELLNIAIEGDFHNAFYDAYYTAEIFKIIHNHNMKPIIYTSSSDKRKSAQHKQKINTISLIKQFEKMYNREMSDEEKSIIKLAYIMGKTGQFKQ
ncbi:sporulation inhibitor KapD [Clostridium puniceum]|uniref:Sporulation inhibitor KapD n=1 Tax=Clostridium puniceum TaxID=29367 RepID=A0A1S8T4C9_9CLOT|nr:3'-5' exonuclease [Clostridium puniceum]OOM72335.1 sporulation inhibitor KapD [Clostridium puniceum]